MGMNEVLRNENALKFEELEVKTVMLENKNEALRLELEDIRDLLQTQPRRTNEERERFRGCMEEDVEGGNIYFTGCNVHIRSGKGSTDATTNGKGNLIIGYNEPRDSLMEVPKSAEGPKKVDVMEVPESAEGLEAELDVSDSRGGSHNLIIGDEHEYTTYGGIVTGRRNGISSKYSAVVGGLDNAASGEYSTVTGGTDNEASGYASSISGGYDNTAWGDYSSVLGGSLNDAQGETAVVTGGSSNEASGELASVVGGKRNKAWKRFSVVTGA